MTIRVMDRRLRTNSPVTADVIVIGGGPSGSVAARLLASWGYDVLLLTKPWDVARALANSLPPSTRKLLAQTGVAELVEQVGFPTLGNTVWWGSDERVEQFTAGHGYQVDRARLDPLLLEAATTDGVRVVADARVLRVDRDELTGQMRVSSVAPIDPVTCCAPIVLDASGRAGVVAVGERLRQQVRGGRMQALLGVWKQAGGWNELNPTHTVIETCDAGWAWSIPTTTETRHVGIMVDGPTSRLHKHALVEDSFRALLTRLPHLARQLQYAQVSRVCACDASVYTATTHAGPGFVLVGDAGCTLNPLSSFGIKKALASAWFAAVVAHTCLQHPERADSASRFFSRWTSELWNMNLLRSRDFAREALERHQSVFWATQASAPVDETALPHDDRVLLEQADVREAFDRMRRADTIVFARSAKATLVSAPLVRGHEIVDEPAVVLGSDARDVVRYLQGVDLVELAAMAPGCAGVPEVIDRYARTHTGVTPPHILGALAVLVARDVLRADESSHLARR